MKTKKNPSGSGSIRQRSDGRWESRVTVGYDKGTGKQVQKSFYGKSQKEVIVKLQKVSVTVDEGSYSEPSKLTVEQWLDIWLKEYVTNAVKPLTVVSYQSMYSNYIKPAFGAVKLSELNPHDIQAFYNDLQRVKNLSPKSIKNVHGVLHSALKQAVRLGSIKVNPTDNCIVPRVIKKEIKPLQDNEIIWFLKEIKGHRFEALFIVDLFTGMRQGELLGLTWNCIDFNRDTILINKQLQKVSGKYILASNKNNKARIISPAQTVMEILKSHKRKQIELMLLLGIPWNEKGYVFTDEFGQHLKHSTVYKNFKRIVKDLGLESTRFHDLRHSYAVAALQAGDDIKTVQETLGHHTAAFTLDVYGHVSDQMKKDSSKRMESFIKSVSGS